MKDVRFRSYLGPTGRPGPPGPTGLSGAPGPTGPWGPTGATGGIGPAGPNGEDGIPGVPGSAGTAGAAGSPGSGGSSGVPGVPGAAGAAGASGGGGSSSSSSSGGGGGGGGGGRSLDFYLFGDGPIGPLPTDLGHFLDAEQGDTETARRASRMDPFYKAGRYLGRIVGNRLRFYSSQIPISAPPGMNNQVRHRNLMSTHSHFILLFVMSRAYWGPWSPRAYRSHRPLGTNWSAWTDRIDWTNRPNGPGWR